MSISFLKTTQSALVKSKTNIQKRFLEYQGMKLTILSHQKRKRLPYEEYGLLFHLQPSACCPFRTFVMRRS